MATLTIQRSDFHPNPPEEDEEVYQAAMLYANGAHQVNSVCIPVGPQPVQDYPWDDRIAEVRQVWGDESGISVEQQDVIAAILIGYRELSDDPEEYETYEAFTYMLRMMSTIAHPSDDVEDHLARVRDWLHEQLGEDPFKEYADVAVQVDGDSDDMEDDTSEGSSADVVRVHAMTQTEE